MKAGRYNDGTGPCLRINSVGAAIVSLIILGAVFTLGLHALARDQAFILTFVDRFEINDRGKDIEELSGLAFSPSDRKLWTASDDMDWMFNLDLNGDLNTDESFDGLVKDFEGITLGPETGTLFAVRERDDDREDAVVQISVDGREIVEMAFLSAMENYNAIEQDFRRGGKNKGLEGITWNPDTGTFFVIKEGKPRMMIEISKDLGSIGRHIILSRNAGFVSDIAGDKKLDVSGMDYDPGRKAFWIVSDKGKRIFLYDREADLVIQSAPLRYVRNGKHKLIDKAEGVALDKGSGQLFIISDEKARLFVYNLR